MELYVHIPFCVRKCNYCDFLSFPAKQCNIDGYLDALERELEANESILKTDTVFVGGGTPSVLDFEQLERLMKMINRCAISERGQESESEKFTEFTVECNPGTLTPEKLKLMHDYGVNRLSIGLQSTDDAQLRTLGRIHDYETFLSTYRMAREAGFNNINIDLISAIPGQSVKAWEDTLTKVAKLEPEHISAYSLIIEPGTPFFELYGEDAANGTAGDVTNDTAGDATNDTAGDVANGTAGDATNGTAGDVANDTAGDVTGSTTGDAASAKLPTEDEEREMYYLTERILSGFGYRRYEISNYAKPGYECRHNLGYWTGEEYYGAGLGASSYLKVSEVKTRSKNPCQGVSTQDSRGGCADSAIRFKNTPDLAEYIKTDDFAKCRREIEKIEGDGMISEYMMLHLRLVEGFCEEDFYRHFGKSFEEVYQPVFDKFEKLGMMKKENGRISLTSRGFDVSNAIMAEFLL